MKRLPLTPAQVTEIWTSRAASRAEFQISFGVPAKRLTAWEAGGAMTASDQILMLVVRDHPEAVKRAIGQLQWQRLEARK